MSVFLFYFEKHVSENLNSFEKDFSLLLEQNFVSHKINIIGKSHKQKYAGFVFHDGTSSGKIYYGDIKDKLVKYFLTFLKIRLEAGADPCFIFEFIHDSIKNEYLINDKKEREIDYEELSLKWKKIIKLDTLFRLSK